MLILRLALLVCISSVCLAQKASMAVVLKNGPEQKYNLCDIREATVRDDSLLVEFVNGSIVGHPLASIDSVYFPRPVTSVSEESIPRKPVASFVLRQNFPNPFNPSTTIQYELQQSGDIETRIYDIRGQLIRTLESGPRHAGVHLVVWDGRSSSRVSVSSGTYFCQIRFNGAVITKKLVLLR